MDGVLAGKVRTQALTVSAQQASSVCVLRRKASKGVQMGFGSIEVR